MIVRFIWFETVTLLISIFAAITADPIVQTPFGKIKGFTIYEDDIPIDHFFGIPYAKPPVGKRRFEKPEMIGKWSGTKDAKAYGASCFSFSVAAPTSVYRENCLFLNIIRPSGLDNTTKLPVFVFIHGGAFVAGDATSYSFLTPTQNFVSQGIIYVTLHYRLGPLGFFTTEDDVAKGNLGLWDQALALEFLHKTISSFGGDPDRITISGQSAGSASVSALLYSPHSYNYFSQAIQISGSSFAEWALSHNNGIESLALARLLGCAGNSSKEILECVKLADVGDMQEAVANEQDLTQWGPRLDGDFLPAESIIELANLAPKKNTIQGVTDGESIAFVLDSVLGPRYGVPHDKWRYFSRNDFIAKFDKSALILYDFGDQTEILRKMALDFYLKPNNSAYYYLHQYVNAMDDMLFRVPIEQEVFVKSQNHWTTYFFVNDYCSSVLNGFGLSEVEYPIKGVVHASELRAIYGFEFIDIIPLVGDDFKFQRNIVDAFVNFIKTGNPSTDRFVWTPTSVGVPFRHLRMNPNPYEATEFASESFQFWNTEVPDKVGARLLRETIFPGTRLD